MPARSPPTRPRTQSRGQLHRVHLEAALEQGRERVRPMKPLAPVSSTRAHHGAKSG